MDLSAIKGIYHANKDRVCPRCANAARAAIGGALRIRVRGMRIAQFPFFVLTFYSSISGWTYAISFLFCGAISGSMRKDEHRVGIHSR